MNLLAVCVGKPKEVPWQGKQVLTSIFKLPVDGPVAVRKENLEGDGQADLAVHGGIDKAVYAYSIDAYKSWKKELKITELPYGSFGENLVIDSFDESKIFIGDQFELGTCLLEVAQPRVPCFKLGIKFGDLKVIQSFNTLHRSGVYFRVKKEGVIQAGASLKLVYSEPVKLSVSELFQIIKDKGITTKERAAECVQIKAIPDKWRVRFQQLADS